MMPTKVVFDIGNVLLRWDMRALFAKLIDDAQELDFFLREVCPMSWHARLDAGALYGDVIAERARAYPRYAQTIRAYDPRWQETIVGPIGESVRVLERLRAAGAPTYAITNFPAEKFDETCALHPFLQGFDGVVVSGRERVTKPDPAIFRLFLARFGLEARDCVFIDDSPANAAAAAALGFHAVRFEEPERLAGQLAALGLPV